MVNVILQSVATLLSLTGNVGVIYNRRWGFGLWILANILWLVFDYRASLYIQMLLFFVYLILAIFGFAKWTKRRTS